MHAIHNARIQLLATLLNTMAFHDRSRSPDRRRHLLRPGYSRDAVVTGAIVWAVPVVVLHGIAQLVLGGLRQ
jgi:hypothetical protein